MPEASPEDSKPSWTLLLSLRELGQLTGGRVANIRNGYRRDSQEILNLLRSRLSVLDYQPARLRQLVADGAFADLDLPPDVIATFPQKAEIGFSISGGYVGFLRDQGIALTDPDILAIRGGRRVTVDEYSQTLVPRAPDTPAPRMPEPQVPEFVMSERQLELIAYLHELEENDFPLDLISLRIATPDDFTAIGISTITPSELIDQVQVHFSHGWRDWVVASDRDPDDIILQARRRSRSR